MNGVCVDKIYQAFSALVVSCVDTLSSAVVVLCFSYIHIWGILIIAFVFICPFWLSCVFVCLYMLSYFDHSEISSSRVSKWLRSSIVFRYLKSWFPMELIVLSDETTFKSSPHIFVLHPHGVMPWAAISLITECCNFSSQFPCIIERHILCASSIFYVPGWRELMLGLGAIKADKQVALTQLQKGHSLVAFPGGIEEQLISQPGTSDVVLSSRKGFVRLAVESGASVVPIYCFGHVETCSQISFALKTRQSLARRLRTAVTIYWGLLFSLVPYRTPVHVVVGNPIESNGKTVEDLHMEYCESLMKLFDKYKSRFPGYENRKLNVL